ncbi:penicillin acylase family protein [Runella slithyformis]|uniref:Acyl-homoserine-lactone acylase n=1 Tax=Runella slithyformis (strain ATCC 29530 / DSM 19594 / LMG 11500 / NCIMB 11436 / LSU 4) TaxID=761193 RepID=A0A7U3ZQ70_RUNSL|nr:penicillin acylase family protein [Runella slithyformis]AEI51355.1 Acyl-homoserine-lactone acylase [Runella slithyformis DSM 19594]
MKPFLLLLALGLFVRCTDSCAQTLALKGLQQPVEIIRDRWGISHIYAQNDHDLFMAQGYVAASDRLFQLEIWRRQATGTTAELLGKKELKRDIGSRLFKFRGNLTAELTHYHPRSALIINAFVEGINAYIREIRQTPEKLPFEFKVLNTLPDYWTPEIVISRHQGLLSNVKDELTNARIVALVGADKLRELQWFHPAKTANEPDLTLDKIIDKEEIFQPILELYEAFRAPLKFTKDDKKAGLTPAFDIDRWYEEEKANVGSNNWIISGKRSQSGYPMLANDPHRAQSVPSLRYWVHLHAPGWNVVGAGEPSLPGVSVGHNDVASWGLTIFETDNEDLYVYETNPQNANQYKYQGKWENLKILKDTVKVAGGPPEVITLRYTRHGPVVFEDASRRKLYAVRAGWLEVGCAPYLASLRMNQARTWEEFRTACSFSRIPGENMIYADKNGHIGWQAVGISPIRKNWTGLVPVPGDGRYEWAGYLPIQLLPHKKDPVEGYVVTANNNMTPVDFPNRNAIGWTWANPVRAHRIEEVLNAGKRMSLQDFATLQTDYLSGTARTLVPVLLKALESRKETKETAKVISLLQGWDYQLTPHSIAAAVYVQWETELKKAVYQSTVPEIIQPYFKTLPTKRLIDWIITPRPAFGADPVKARNELLVSSLGKALQALTARLGSNIDQWQYGQAKNKHITLTHALSDWVSADQRAKINLGPLPRGGYGEVVGNTGNNLNQEHGASFRILVDTEDWDNTLGINSPGQSANPDDPHYADLFELWAKDGYFPVYFSKDKIKNVADRTWTLKPN